MAKPRVPLSLLLPPLFAVAVLGFSLTLGAHSRAVRAAQIFAGPTDSVHGFRGRVRLISERDGALQPVARENVTMMAQEGNRRVSRRLISDLDGWAEFEFPRDPTIPLAVEVMDSDGALLSRGRISLDTEDWAERARRRGFGDQELIEGPIALRLRIEGGVLAVPYESVIELWLLRWGQALSDTPVEISVEGGRSGGGRFRRTDPKGHLELSFTPDEHSAMLNVKVQDGETARRFQQTLPVVPGAFSLDRGNEHWQVRSPVPRDHAWFTRVTEKWRGPGGRIALEPTSEGGSIGTLPFPNEPIPANSYLVLSGDASGLSLGTVGIPLDGQGATFDASDLLVLDSLPRKVRAARAKERRARFILGLYVFVAGLLTLGLFSFHLRRSEKTLSRELFEAGVTSRAKESSRLPLLFAIVSLFFAFSLAVLWIVAR